MVLFCANMAQAQPVGLCVPFPVLHHSINDQIAACATRVRAVGSARALPGQRASAYYVRGLLYHLSHKYDLAIADYSSAIGWKQNFADAYQARGDAYEDAGQHEKASADYAQAATMQSAIPDVLTARCWVRAARGHPLDRALADCNAAFKAGADSRDAYFVRCFAFYRASRYSDAVTDCDKAEPMQHRHAAALYVSGLAKLRLGDAKGGNADIAAALDADFRIADVFALYGINR
jgi:tetratricopeptide (TPR) repeat protein